MLVDLSKNRRSFDDKLQRSIAKCCTQADRRLRIFNEERTFSLSLKMATFSFGKKSQKPGDAHGRPVEKSTAHPPGPACILRRRPPARPEQKNEKDAHPPIGRVSQKGRVGARPALSEVLLRLHDAPIWILITLLRKPETSLDIKIDWCQSESSREPRCSWRY